MYVVCLLFYAIGGFLFVSMFVFVLSKCGEFAIIRNQRYDERYE